MRGRYLTPLPAVMLAVTVLLEIAAVGLSWDLESRFDTLVYAVYSVATVAAGALVASRRPGNPIGWLFCAFGAFNALTADAAQGWGLRAAEQGWPGGPAAEWVAMMSWLPSGVGLILTFLLFPDGRLPGRRWRPVVWVAPSASPSPCPAGHSALTKPRVHGRPEPARRRTRSRPARSSRSGWCSSSEPCRVGPVIDRAFPQVPRRRAPSAHVVHVRRLCCRGRPPGLVRALVRDPGRGRAGGRRAQALPVAASVAILRYRLYDIDVVIDRTLVYGTLTSCWARCSPPRRCSSERLGSGSSWATAGATLLVAVAFRPLRGRVQDAVDRRFSRARYGRSPADDGVS